MDSNRWNEVEKLYHAALECELREPNAFLDRNRPDETLRNDRGLEACANKRYDRW